MQVEKAEAEAKAKARECRLGIAAGFGRGGVPGRPEPARQVGPAHASPAGVTSALALALASASASLAAQHPQPYTQRIPGTVVSLEMVPVPAGSVTIETADGPRTIDVGPFWIAKTETTWDLYDVYVYELDRAAPMEAGVDAVSRPTKPYVLPGDEYGHDGMPALGMSLNAAREFARWLSARTGRTYRVPGEAQWEHACRLGAAREELGDVAWTAGDSDYRTHEVGSKPADALGLHDMLGNVAEWVESARTDSVVKGGTFETAPTDVSCSSRLQQAPAWQATDPQLPKSRWWFTDAPFVGLRLIRLPDEPADTGGQP